MHWSWSWPLAVLEGWVDGWHVVALHPLWLYARSSGYSRSSLHWVWLARDVLHLFF